MNDNNRETVEPRNVTMYLRQWATVDAHAKDAGYGNTSAALRRIVDEWVQFKGQQLGFDLPSTTNAIPASP